MPAQNVEVQVKNSLPRLFTVVGDDTVPTIIEAARLSRLCRQRQQIGCDHRVVKLAQVSDMLFRHHEHVYRRRRRDVIEHDTVLALRDELGAELALRDLAEDTVLTQGFFPSATRTG
jgi:hypothetical protein